MIDCMLEMGGLRVEWLRCESGDVSEDEEFECRW